MLTGIGDVEAVFDEQRLGLLDQQLLLLRARHVSVLLKQLPHDELLFPEHRHDRIPVESCSQRAPIQPQHVLWSGE